jgi:hypothetical protein
MQSDSPQTGGYPGFLVPRSRKNRRIFAHFRSEERPERHCEREQSNRLRVPLSHPYTRGTSASSSCAIKSRIDSDLTIFPCECSLMNLAARQGQDRPIGPRRQFGRSGRPKTKELRPGAFVFQTRLAQQIRLRQ